MLDSIGVIGCGAMGGSLAKGLASSGLVRKERVLVSDADGAKTAALAREYGVTVCDNLTAASCALCVLAVKPQQYPAALAQIAPALAKNNTLLVTVAPGFTLARLSALLAFPAAIIRAMPNTPVLVGEGMIAVCQNEYVTEEMFSDVCALLACLGRVERVPESLMDCVVGISGSAPAYVFLLMDAMRTAAIRGGMQKEQATRMIAQTVLGAGKLALETGKSPAELCDMVTSPAGTTIEAVCTLEEKGFRDAVIAAVKACSEKSARM